MSEVRTRENPDVQVTCERLTLHMLPFDLLGLDEIAHCIRKKASGVWGPLNSEEQFLGQQVDFLESKSKAECGHQFAIRESWVFRTIWAVIMVFATFYIATVFMYRLCFLDFHIPRPIPSCGSMWAEIDTYVHYLLIGDLVLNFFFTYRDRHGTEVADLWCITKRYLRTFFVVDLIACSADLPVLLIAHFAPHMGRKDDCRSEVANSLRIFRLQRLTRLTRLIRIASLTKVRDSAQKRFPEQMRWLEGLRIFRVCNFSFFLLWMVHLLGCGWYLCASLHQDPAQTWVARRFPDPTDSTKTLMTVGAEEQWVHSMYFILTVFTTVGFGDIHGLTPLEMKFVCMVMIVGTVIHSIIISEVIAVLTKVDQAKEFQNKQIALVQAFAQHAGLDAQAMQRMQDCVSMRTSLWQMQSYDKHQMEELITGKYMPRSLMAALPAHLFHGKLMRNNFFHVQSSGVMPPRLPLLLALSVSQSFFIRGEIIYQIYDNACNAFLVLSGTFATVARPTDTGGEDEEPVHRIRGSSGNVTASMGHMALPNVFRLMGLEMQHNRVQTAELDETKRFEGLSPYRLFCSNSYFGDLELFRSCPRYATVRCESHGGASVLVLQRKELLKITEEFQQFGRAWRCTACRRESARQRQLARLTQGVDFKSYAALTIQRVYRAHRQSAHNVACHVKPNVQRRETKQYSIGNSSKSSIFRSGKPSLELTVQRLVAEVSAMRKDLNELRADLQPDLERTRTADSNEFTI